MSELTYFGVQKRLASIEEDLGKRQNGYEQAAEALARVNKEVEHRLANIRLTLRFGKDEKDTVQIRADKAITNLAAAEDDLYDRWVAAEASYAGQKAAIDVLGKRASIGQSLLKAMQNEASQNGQQPAWSQS